MENKKEKVQVLADKLETILPLIDNFMEGMSEEDFQLLEESRDSLKDKISTNNSALALIYACGGIYDDTEDYMKIKTLDCLIDLLKVRHEYREKKLELIEKQQKQQEVLNLFGLMGM